MNSGSNFLNESAIIRIEARDTYVTPLLRRSLQEFAEECGVTICLKMSAAPNVLEFEPQVERKRQLRQGFLLAGRQSTDAAGLEMIRNSLGGLDQSYGPNAVRRLTEEIRRCIREGRPGFGIGSPLSATDISKALQTDRRNVAAALAQLTEEGYLEPSRHGCAAKVFSRNMRCLHLPLGELQFSVSFLWPEIASVFGQLAGFGPPIKFLK